MASWDTLTDGDLVRYIDDPRRLTFFILTRYSPNLLLLKEVGNMQSGETTVCDKVRKLSPLEVLAVLADLW